MIFDPEKIYWQAHRGGGGYEAPDNTLFAVKYGWSLGGIPEVDIRMTGDGKVICLHDNTLARTTDAPEAIADKPVKMLDFATVKKFDAGRKFSEAHAGEKVPALSEVLELMRLDPEKMLYADIKNYDEELFPLLLKEFGKLVYEYGAASQIIVANGYYEFNCKIKEAYPEIKTMLWIGYTPEERMEHFRRVEEKDFANLDLVQLHLYPLDEPQGNWMYDLPLADLKYAVDALGSRLEVFPVGNFTKSAIKTLLDLNIRRFTTDEPARFCKIMSELV
ncbi:MAG: glycerophosphodiester phosphodiesterase [Lentisphaerae bacterium]|nr:glycerophosphodiester phosphodiesterase [Lentisphaerota bacterium]